MARDEAPRFRGRSRRELREKPPRELSILMTTDAVGGVWTYALELAESLAERGVRMTLATMGDPPSLEQRRQAAAIPRLCLFESSFRLEWMDDPWDDVERAGRWLLDLERRVAPDVVHLNGYCHAALPFRAPKLVVAHSCVLSWWEAVKTEPLPDRYRRYAAEVARGVQAATRVVAPSEAMLRSIERHYGTPKDARVLLNGHDPRSLVRGEKQPIVLCAARVWDEAKNVATLARAAKELLWPVFVAGEHRAPSGGAPAHFDQLMLLGRLERPAALGWLTRAAIFALPALYAPFGLSALEAACSGAALVLGDIPSLREIWGDAAVYVPPRDERALMVAINGLITDDHRRSAFAGRARERGLMLSAARMAARYRETYAELARRARRGARASKRDPERTIE